MSKVAVTPEEAEYIAARIAGFPHEASAEQQWQLPHVSRFNGLPLYVGWTETIGIQSDGTLIRWSTEEEYIGTKEVDDPVWVRCALVEGAKKYPDLRSLIPVRPPGARPCDGCGGAGYPPGWPNITCSCGGVGWVDSHSPSQS